MINTYCVFCNSDTTTSKSVEHIIPESLGNDKITIEKSFICDKCNNYFSSHIEKPFLELEIIKNLRTFYKVPSKKNKIPSYKVNFLGDEAMLDIINNKICIGISPETYQKLIIHKPKVFFSKIPEINTLENNYIVSRFLLKIFTELNIYYAIENFKVEYNDEEITWQFDAKMKEYFDYVRFGNPNKIYNYKIKKLREFQLFPTGDDVLISSVNLIFDGALLSGMKFILYDLEFILAL